MLLAKGQGCTHLHGGLVENKDGAIGAWLGMHGLMLERDRGERHRTQLAHDVRWPLLLVPIPCEQGGVLLREGTQDDHEHGNGCMHGASAHKMKACIRHTGGGRAHQQPSQRRDIDSRRPERHSNRADVPPTATPRDTEPSTGTERVLWRRRVCAQADVRQGIAMGTPCLCRPPTVVCG